MSKGMHSALKTAVLGAAIALTAGMVQADDSAVVTAFYTEGLTVSPGTDAAAAFGKVLSENWQSIGDYSGKAKTRDEFVQQIGGFHKLIPDMTFKIEDMVISGDTYVVRSRASGTPVGPMFGVDGKGKSFTIMTIDIHKVSDGKIVTSHHVEDWAGALKQLKAE